MKKIEKSIMFLQEHLLLLRCPICHSPFEKIVDNSISCMENHCFNLSKKGTVYFLRHQIHTDYQANVFSARQKINQAGFFTPIVEQVMSHVNLGDSEQVTLDVGCGEGSFLEQSVSVGLSGTTFGFDIAKEGIALATNQPTDTFWFVADLTNIPLANLSVDNILNIFSPSQYQEMLRLLKPNGRLLKVVPNSHYLYELRQLLYADNLEKKSYSNEVVVAHFNKYFTKVTVENICYTFPLTDELYDALLMMTPLTWGANEKDLAIAKNKKLTEITIDVQLLVGEK